MNKTYGEAPPETLFPVCFLDAETQAVMLTGLCCIGAWVIFKWIIQLIFSVIWPLFAIAGIMVLVPSLRRTIAYDILPKHIIATKSLIRRLITTFNSLNSAE